MFRSLLKKRSFLREIPVGENIYENIDLLMTHEDNSVRILDRGMKKPVWFESRWISKKILLLNLNFSSISSLHISTPICSQTDEKLKIIKFGAKKSESQREGFNIKIRNGM